MDDINNTYAEGSNIQNDENMLNDTSLGTY